MNQKPRGESRGIYLVELKAVGRAGADAAAMAEKFGVSRAGVMYMLKLLRDESVIEFRWAGGKVPARWYALGMAPAPVDRAANRHTVSANRQQLKLDPEAPVVVPPGVTVQVIPAGYDHRFTADPALAGRGVISRDWRERRLQESQR